MPRPVGISIVVGLFLGLVLSTSCKNRDGDDAVSSPAVGGPLEGLSAADLAAFSRGKTMFEKRFKPSEGLGPFYNGTSCASCHSHPTVGGSSELYRNFYLAAAGPPGFQLAMIGLPSIVVPAYGSGFHTSASFQLEGARIQIPTGLFGLPVTVAQRNAPPVFGVGLFETISDITIMSNADPDDSDSDGISGRFNRDQGAIGRFGYKAQSNNIETFTRAPLNTQMGITSDPVLGAGGVVSLRAGGLQATTDPTAPIVDNDGIPDPEISVVDLADMIAFTRLLAPPVPKAFSASARDGETLFSQIGCAACHIPRLDGSAGPVNAYTDLLIHDMGPDLADGIHFGAPQMSSISPGTTESEWRTAPLWGVSLHAPYLHDGRAETLQHAIELHAGEGLTSASAFMNLTTTEQQSIIAFLEAL
ncbi:MAG: di-heme oxidoredictase family protein [Planctomycetota bacterium]